MLLDRIDKVHERINALILSNNECHTTMKTDLALIKKTSNDHLHSHQLDAEARVASRNDLYRNITVLVSTIVGAAEVVRIVLGVFWK